jgi:hypothetical protein
MNHINLNNAERLRHQAIVRDEMDHQDALTLMQNISECNVMALCRDRHLNAKSIETFRCHVFREDREHARECHFDIMDRIRPSINGHANNLLVGENFRREDYDAFNEALSEDGCVFRLYKDVNDYLGNFSNCQELFALQLSQLVETRRQLYDRYYLL